MSLYPLKLSPSLNFLMEIAMPQVINRLPFLSDAFVFRATLLLCLLAIALG